LFSGHFAVGRGACAAGRGPLRPLRGHLPLKGEDVVVFAVLGVQGAPPAASRPCCAMPTAAPPMRSAPGALLPLKGEDVAVLGILGVWEALFRPFRGQGSLQSALVPSGHTSSVSLDRVVRSVSVSEQSDESGTDPSIRRPPSPSIPIPDSRPGTRHQPLNPANHRLSAPGPHRGSRGTYGAKRVVPRPEGPRGGRSSPRKPGGVRGTESPADARAVSLKATSTEDTVPAQRAGPPPTASRPPPPIGP